MLAFEGIDSTQWVTCQNEPPHVVLRQVKRYLLFILIFSWLQFRGILANPAPLLLRCRCQTRDIADLRRQSKGFGLGEGALGAARRRAFGAALFRAGERSASTVGRPSVAYRA